MDVLGWMASRQAGSWARAGCVCGDDVARAALSAPRQINPGDPEGQRLISWAGWGARVFHGWPGIGRCRARWVERGVGQN